MASCAASVPARPRYENETSSRPSELTMLKPNPPVTWWTGLTLTLKPAGEVVAHRVFSACDEAQVRLLGLKARKHEPFDDLRHHELCLDRRQAFADEPVSK